jgi:FKBP-type peptidyl-prolyl cis-trans isomerase FkpA
MLSVLIQVLLGAQLSGNPHAPWYEYQHQLLRKNAMQPGWQITLSGLQMKRLSESGSGQRPSATDLVTVHYIGTDVSGKILDSSIERGEPATFQLDQVIKGWTEGVQRMRVGEMWEFLIPASLAYGDRGFGSTIPPGSSLRFQIELLATKPVAEERQR